MLSFYVFIFLACVSSALALITVKTEYGPVWSDVVVHTKHGNRFLAFRGIPYAAPPVGHLRFKSPQKPEKWEEAKNATTQGAACYQFSGRRGVERRGVTLPYGISEDCLFVNVYTPEVEPKKLRPVLVYIHGGAFQVGTGNWFHANNFMDAPAIVMVTFNYRLGVFGFLSSGDHVLPGNYGLKDQVAALKWVQANIKNFGGDPKNVTLMGQSSGGHNVHTHTLSHASEGLFQRAIILSGSALSLWGYYPPQSHEAHHSFNLLLEQAKCKKGHLEASIECLREMSPKDLKQAEQHFLANHTIPFVFRPVIEPSKVPDAFLTTDPRELKYPNPKIPIIVGVCSAEGMMNALMFLGGHSGQHEFSRILDDMLPYTVHYKYWLKPEQVPVITDRLKNFFFENPRSITEADVLNLNKLFGKITFQMPAVDTAMSYPGKVYAYYYDHLNQASPFVNMKNTIPQIKYNPLFANFTGAEHGDDLISIFGAFDPKAQQLPAADQKVSDQMLVYLKNFIITGNPNSKGMHVPKWNAVYTKRVEYLHVTKEGCRLNTGWAEDPTYAFYRSLPIPWHRVTSDVAGVAARHAIHDVASHKKIRVAKHAQTKSERKTRQPAQTPNKSSATKH